MNLFFLDKSLNDLNDQESDLTLANSISMYFNYMYS